MELVRVVQSEGLSNPRQELITLKTSISLVPFPRSPRATTNGGEWTVLRARRVVSDWVRGAMQSPMRPWLLGEIVMYIMVEFDRFI